MQESSSKFLFDQNSQGLAKFEDAMNFSPFNSRFPPHNFDLFFNDASILNKSFHSIRTPTNLNSDTKPKHKYEETASPHKESPLEPKLPNIHTSGSDLLKGIGKRPEKNNTDRSPVHGIEGIPGIIRPPISKSKDLKAASTKNNTHNQADSIFVRLYPKNLTTKSLMLRLNNFPRLEIKTSKKNNLKKILDHLRKKWLTKINSVKTPKFDIQLTPNHHTWLKHLEEINKMLGLSQEEAPLTENYMLADIWAGYNEPSSNKIDLFYEIKPLTTVPEDSTPYLIFQQLQQKHSSTIPTPQQPQMQSFTPVSQSFKKIQKKAPIVEEIKEESASESSRSEELMPTKKPSPQQSQSQPQPIAMNPEPISHSNSAFSFNEASRQSSNSTRFPPNEQSIKLLYNHLNQHFPDDTKFTSQLSKNGQNGPTPTVIKQIPVKRKTQ